MDFLSLAVANLERGIFGWAVVAVLLTVFEVVNARERIPFSARVAGMAFWAINIPLSTLLVTGLSMCMKALDIQPLLTLPAFAAFQWAGPLAAVTAIFAAATVNDFFFYWYHRIQHRWLWRFHAVHHAIRDLSAINSYHHISETVVALILYTIPISLVISDVGPTLPLINLLLWVHIVWIHSPTRFHFGPLRAILVDNRFHRVHHSLEERHFDKNFGAFTTLWDRLFGTAYFPAHHDWPAVGLAEVDQPTDVKQWLDLPTRWQKAVSVSQSTISTSLHDQPNRPSWSIKKLEMTGDPEPAASAVLSR